MYQDTTRCITVACLPLQMTVRTGLLLAASHRLVSFFETRETQACLSNEIKTFATQTGLIKKTYMTHSSYFIKNTIIDVSPPALHLRRQSLYNISYAVGDLNHVEIPGSFEDVGAIEQENWNTYRFSFLLGLGTNSYAQSVELFFMCCSNKYNLPTLSCLFPSITVSKTCAKKY